MTGTKGTITDYVYGYPYRPRAQNDEAQYIAYPAYDLLPGSPSTFRSRRSCCNCSACSRVLLVSLLLVSLGAVGYMLFPMDPTIRVTGITLEKISIHVDEQNLNLPSVHLDVSVSLKMKITNPNFLGVAYDNVTVFVYYRGDKLGDMQCQGGSVPSRSVSVATASLALQSAVLREHATHLIEDMARGKVPLQTVTLFSGAVEMFFLSPQIKMKVFCNILVDPKEKEVMAKDCSLLPR